MNTFLTHLVRGDHSLQLAAHLAAGILSLLLLFGAAWSEREPVATASAPLSSHASTAAMVVDTAIAGD